MAATILGTIVNNDGNFHTTGWELDLTTKMAKAFFDGVQIGAAFDVSGEHGTLEDDLYLFGTGSSAHMNNTWTRVVVQEGDLTGGPGPTPRGDFTWNVNSFGEWTTANNWDPSSAYPGDPTRRVPRTIRQRSAARSCPTERSSPRPPSVPGYHLR